MPACDPGQFVNREKELSRVIELIIRLARGDPFAPQERVIHFIGPSGIGKSCLLEKCISIPDDVSGYIPILLRLETLRLDGDDFVANFLIAVDREICSHLGISKEKKANSLQTLSSEALRRINKEIKDKVFILYLDEINIPQKEELRGIEEHLLERLIQDNDRAVLVTAGRSPVGLNHFSLRPSSANTFLLSTFDEETTGEQLEKLKPGLKSLADKILELGNGVPGSSRKLAEHVIGAPPQIPNELEAIQSLLADVKSEIDERFHPVIEAVCVLQLLYPDDAAPLLECHPMLGNQWHERRIREIFTDFNKIQLGPGGLINWDREKKSWVMDEPTRALFERELQMRAPELWKKLHCTAYQMFAQWGEEYDSQLYRDKAAYHQRRLQSAGVNCNDLGNEG